MSCVTKGVSVRWIFVHVNIAEATVHARPGRGAEGVLGFSGRARTGPVDVERPARPILQRYHERSYSGGHRARPAGRY